MLLTLSYIHTSHVERIQSERPKPPARKEPTLAPVDMRLNQPSLGAAPPRKKKAAPVEPQNKAAPVEHLQAEVPAQGDAFVYQPSMKTDLQHVQRLLAYWRPDTSPVVEPKDPPQYVAFETDAGGFNNIRMGFEFVVGALKDTGKTLVLPPPEGPTDAWRANMPHALTLRHRLVPPGLGPTQCQEQGRSEMAQRRHLLRVR